MFIVSALADNGLPLLSPTFLAPGTSCVEDNFSTDWGGHVFRMIQVHCIYCALYFYYYYIAIYNEIIIQLIIMQNQWEPWACFPATRWSHLGVMGEITTEVCCLCPVYSIRFSLIVTFHSRIGFWYESASNWFIMVSVQLNLSANDNLYFQPLPRASITASAPSQIIRHWILISSAWPRSLVCAVHSRVCTPMRI